MAVIQPLVGWNSDGALGCPHLHHYLMGVKGIDGTDPKRGCGPEMKVAP